MKLKEQKSGQWNQDDRLDLARLLVKGGYQVAIRKEKKDGKSGSVTYIEVVGDGEEATQS